jgi:hypothetical protein
MNLAARLRGEGVSPGDVVVVAIERVRFLQATVNRHEILRTRFVWRKGTWWLVEEPEATAPTITVDLIEATMPISRR